MSESIDGSEPQSKRTPKTTSIYVLIDPRDDTVRYVGKTNNLKARMYRHLFDASSLEHNTYKDRWIRGLQAAGLEPIMQVREEVPYAEWEARECYWIEMYRAQGSPLTNTAKGGRGGQGITSEEARARISAAKKGTKYKPTSEEGRRNMGIARSKYRHTPETKAKMSAIKTGTKASTETRARLSASHTGKPSPKKGCKMSPETKAKMSASKKQMFAMRKMPPDQSTLWD